MLYSSFTKNEHGIAFSGNEEAAIAAFKITSDRFVELTTESNAEGILSTRENIWNSGEVHINLSCKSATFAVYESTGYDLLGYAHEIEGYSHKDCIPFSGDTTNWTPRFKNKKTLDKLLIYISDKRAKIKKSRRSLNFFTSSALFIFI